MNANEIAKKSLEAIAKTHFNIELGDVVQYEINQKVHAIIVSQFRFINHRFLVVGKCSTVIKPEDIIKIYKPDTAIIL